MPRPKFQARDARKKNAWGTAHYGSRALVMKRVWFRPNSHANTDGGCLPVFYGEFPCLGMHGPIRRTYGGAGGALYLGGLQQLPAGRPLALRSGGEGLHAWTGGAAFAACRLLGLHRLEG